MWTTNQTPDLILWLGLQVAVASNEVAVCE